MTELEDKITREIQILNDERQYMKQLAEDVEVGKFGEQLVLLLQSHQLNHKNLNCALHDANQGCTNQLR